MKAPLGCLAFVIGASTVFVLFMPPACGRVIEADLERQFAHAFAGRLELGDSWLLSLYDDQSIERIVLRDPDGQEVLNGRWSAPSMWNAWEDRSRRVCDLGRLALIHADLFEHEDGTTNIGRALAPNPTLDGVAFQVSVDDSGLQLSFGTGRDYGLGGYDEYALDLAVERLGWSTPRLRELGTDAVMRGVRGRVSLRDPSSDDFFRLTIDGRVDGDPSGDMRVGFTIPRPGGVVGNTLTVGGERVPLAPIDDLLGSDGELTKALGGRAELLEFSSEALGEGRSRTELELRSEVAALELRGTLNTFELVVTGDEGIVLEVNPEASPWRRFFVGTSGLLAILSEVRPLDDEPWRMTVRKFEVPLTRDIARLSGTFEITLGRIAWKPPVSLLVGLGIGLDAELESTVRGAVLRVEEGRVHYASLALNTGESQLVLDGTHDLGSGEVDLLMSLPPALVTDPTRASMQATGPWSSLTIELPSQD